MAEEDPDEIDAIAEEDGECEYRHVDTTSVPTTCTSSRTSITSSADAQSRVQQLQREASSAGPENQKAAAVSDEEYKFSPYISGTNGTAQTIESLAQNGPPILIDSFAVPKKSTGLQEKR